MSFQLYERGIKNTVATLELLFIKIQLIKCGTFALKTLYMF